MPLRRSPHRTTAFLGACLSNSRKSTGPRTPRGKAHSCLNALKHGRYAKDFRRLVLGRNRRTSASTTSFWASYTLLSSPKPPPTLSEPSGWRPRRAAGFGCAGGPKARERSRNVSWNQRFHKVRSHRALVGWRRPARASGCGLRRGCVLRSRTASRAGEWPCGRIRGAGCGAGFGCR